MSIRMTQTSRAPSSDQRPFGPEEAAHLARRAGFGATPEELRKLVELGRSRAVASFLDVPDVDVELEAELQGVGGELADLETGPGVSDQMAIESLRRRWLYRLARSRQPLREKLTLFWHDHFACSERKVLRIGLVRDQLELLRRGALGTFGELVHGIASDPCMLVFLDGRLNHREGINENFARELLELFTLGVDRYEQADVRELARVFTGWSTPDRAVSRFVFEAPRHDPGEKRLFGQRIRGREGQAGMEEGHEAIDIILAQPACAEFLAHKLVAFFTGPVPDLELEAAVAEGLRSSGLSIREGLRTLFLHPRFEAPEHRHSSVRSPVEWVASAARLLEIQNVHLAGLGGPLRIMGMELFQPPSVDGWPSERAWASPGAVSPRLAAAIELTELPHAAVPIAGRAALDLDRLAGPGASEGASGGDSQTDSNLVRSLAERLLGPAPPEELLEVLVAALSELPGSRRDTRTRTRFLLHALLVSPSFGRA